ncbi:response regulator transcription factor [Rhizobium wenxiniae]|uniref:helix-turn-helix transcriptional regulator n=1 Tax=Rhizobium wenxiniae TaxID=1737357 RepID=UPI003C255559
MPNTPLIAIRSEADLVDLRSLPTYRRIKENAFIERIKKSVAFDYVTVTGMDVDGYRLGEANFHIESDVPPALVEVYVADRLYETDPLLRHVLETRCAALESLVYPQTGAPSRLRQLADDFSVRNRTVFPIARGAIVIASVCFMRKHPFADDEILFLKEVSRAVYQSVVGELVERFAAESAGLTEGELICLRLAADGLTAAEISENSRYQTNTVDSYLKAATKKLGARNRTHAIGQAIRRGLI